jgi:hypothetical protein
MFLLQERGREKKMLLAYSQTVQHNTVAMKKKRRAVAA